MNTDRTKIESETIDWLRPVMAFMVICLHAQLFYIDEQWSMNGGVFNVFVIYLCKVICPVAVPAFFFISGYLFYKGLQKWDYGIWKSKMVKRIKTLLVPFVIWNLIALIAFPLTRYAGSLLKGLPMDNLIEVIRDRGFLRLFWDRTLFDGNSHSYINILGWIIPNGQPMDTPMWFVRDLMVVVLFTPAIHWLIKKTGQVFIAVLAVLFMVDIWFPVSGFSIKATFFFSWGALFSIKGNNVIESFRKIRIPSTVLFLMGLLLIPLLWDKDRYLFSLTLRLFIIIELVFCFNLVSSLIEKQRIRVNTHLKNSSFFVYCSHMVIVASAVMWLVMLPQQQTGIIKTLLFITGSVVIFLICHFMYMFLERYCPSIAAVLTGGRNNKK